jgi:acetyl esterase/lipase
MRKTGLLTLALSLLLGLVATARADDQPDLKTFLNKAIQATGGKEKLTRFKAATWKGKGKLYLVEEGIDFTGEWSAQLPGQIREVVEGEYKGVKNRREKVVNGDKGWTKTNEGVAAMDPGTLQNEKEQLYGEWIATLVPLLDKDFQLTPLGESKVGDRPVRGIKVARQGHLDVNLFLDRDKGVVLKREVRVPGLVGEVLYDNYKEVAGLQRYHKTTLKINGKVLLETELRDIKALEKLDDEVFARPSGPAVVSTPPFKRTEDVIYGRKYGMALTLDVFTPTQNANGLGVIFVVSGGWFSSHEGTTGATGLYRELLDRGYTVFAVCHGSQPMFTIPEAVEDLNRAVRFIRYHAKDYHIDPDHIGITGGSAGGHLSLMQGMAGGPGNPKAPDPVDRVSSQVQAVACFFPPTDFLNYGEPGKDALGRGVLAAFKAPFSFRELDPKTKAFAIITDEDRRREIGRQISPITHVTSDSPPTLIAHGDADKIVPIQQAESIIAKLKEKNVPAELIVKPGAGHGWAGMEKDVKTFADWYDKYLKAK